MPENHSERDGNVLFEGYFERLESVLLGENRACLDEIKERFYYNIKLREEDIKIDEEENDRLMDEISQNNEEIRRLRDQVVKMNGKVEDNNRLNGILKKNDARLKILKRKAKAIEKDKETLKRSYAAQLGHARRRHSDAITTLENIYIDSNKKQFKIIENFKSRVQKSCKEIIKICSTCNRPNSHCKCE
jgi:hypothetical protein